MKKLDFFDFVKHLPPESDDRTLVIIKGFLLIESALHIYIGRRVERAERLKEGQIGFAHLVDFASCLENTPSIDWLWVAAKKLNSARNKLSHSLDPEDYLKKEKDFLDYVRHQDGELTVLVDNNPQHYPSLSIAIFQLFERLISMPPTHKEPTAQILDDALNSALSALQALGRLEAMDYPSRPGPPARRKKGKVKKWCDTP